jgi:hypothetical protein
MWSLLAACREPTTAPTDGPPAHAPHSSAPEPACPEFGPGEVAGVVSVPVPDEISGLAAWDDVLWAVDDGDPALYAFDRAGALLATAGLDPAVVGVDREDVARVGDHLVIADVGDNLGARVHVTLWAFDRPPSDRDTEDWPLASRTVLTWPDGPRDAETLLADPVSGDVLVVEKATDGVSSVIRVPSPLPAEAVGEEVAVLRFGEGPLAGPTLATGGAVAPDGTAVVIRTYLDAWVWPRAPGEPWADTFGREPCAVELLTEPQGEAVTFAEDGLYTVSEGSGEPVLFYPLLGR